MQYKYQMIPGSVIMKFNFTSLGGEKKINPAVFLLFIKFIP